jgi:hypothetical protein
VAADQRKTAPPAQPTFVPAERTPERTTPSPALAAMLRMPSGSEQRGPLGAIGHDPLPAAQQAQAPAAAPAPIVRPPARVVPASAALPAEEPLIERLPPIVSPTDARNKARF